MSESRKHPCRLFVRLSVHCRFCGGKLYESSNILFNHQLIDAHSSFIFLGQTWKTRSNRFVCVENIGRLKDSGDCMYTHIMLMWLNEVFLFATAEPTTAASAACGNLSTSQFIFSWFNVYAYKFSTNSWVNKVHNSLADTFGSRPKFVITWSLKIPPNLIHVATLPCKTLNK